LVADDNSAVTNVENYVTVNNEPKGIVSIVEEVIAEKNARSTFGGVDNLASDVTTYVNRRGHIRTDRQIEWALGLMNDGDT
ncbi:Fe-S cluster assembly protein SufD, partial [Listeria monocytogenes]|nr:Fe-S cluster assembly protein SufD [Listeria monocytogenes]